MDTRAYLQNPFPDLLHKVASTGKEGNKVPPEWLSYPLCNFVNSVL